MSDIIIKAENVAKRYQLNSTKAQGLREYLTTLNFKKRDQTSRENDSFWALRDINFEIKRGEAVGIIGRNGAGKSTLLKVLSRITAPTVGRITLKGRVSSLLEVGTGFHPELTGKENIYLNGTILGMKRREIKEKYDEIIDFSGVEQFLDTPVKHYSSGMYVRLAFAVAAHLDPDILIIDEVLAVGDSEFQKKCLGKMNEVTGAGRTVLFVSHNMAAVSKLCSKAIFLNKGQIIFNGGVAAGLIEYEKSQASSSTFVLGTNKEALERSKSSGFELINAKITNAESGKKVIHCGDDLILSFSYKVSKPFIAPAFVVSFKDLLGVEIFRLSTQPISGFEIKSLGTEGVVSLLIEKLPLVAGVYSIDFGFVRESMEWILSTKNLFKLDVLAKDVYQSGLSLDRSRGIIWVNHKWSQEILQG